MDFSTPVFHLYKEYLFNSGSLATKLMARRLPSLLYIPSIDMERLEGFMRQLGISHACLKVPTTRRLAEGALTSGRR
jgi:hypothetical protein